MGCCCCCCCCWLLLLLLLLSSLLLLSLLLLWLLSLLSLLLFLLLLLLLLLSLLSLSLLLLSLLGYANSCFSLRDFVGMFCAISQRWGAPAVESRVAAWVLPRRTRRCCCIGALAVCSVARRASLSLETSHMAEVDALLL